MKIRNFYKTLIPLLLALFNVMGSGVYSYNPAVPELGPRNYDNLQEDQNTSAIILEEVSIHVPGQVNLKNDLVTGSFFISGKSIFNGSFLNDNKPSSNIIRDKKAILKINIFPFHFFW